MLPFCQHALVPLFALKVLQFYAVPGEIVTGEQSLICYGVEDAVSVRIEPAVEKLSPSLSRCIGVSPKRDTTYKLIAQGPSQERESRTLRIVVKPVPRPAPEIRSFTASATRLEPGDTVTLCFFVENTDSVRLEPSMQDLGRATLGCFAVAPEKTTTFTLIAAGAAGKTARKQVTVQVP